MRAFFSFLCFFFFPLAGTLEKAPTVLVTVAPYSYAIEMLGNGSILPKAVVPSGANAHSFDPTPKEVLQFTEAKAWFYIGESFELRILRALKACCPNIKFFDLKEGVDLIYSECCHKEGFDPHIWLSVKEMKKQSSFIAKNLKTLFPEKEQTLTKGEKKLEAALDDLERTISELRNKSPVKAILAAHPAFGYFCRDWHLIQLNLEHEGKDPTPFELAETLKKAKDFGIKKIYIQPQYSQKAAKIVAKELGAALVVIDPYEENYKDNLLRIAKSIFEEKGP